MHCRYTGRQYVKQICGVGNLNTNMAGSVVIDDMTSVGLEHLSDFINELHELILKQRELIAIEERLRNCFPQKNETTEEMAVRLAAENSLNGRLEYITGAIAMCATCFDLKICRL